MFSTSSPPSSLHCYACFQSENETLCPIYFLTFIYLSSHPLPYLMAYVRTINVIYNEDHVYFAKANNHISVLVSLNLSVTFAEFCHYRLHDSLSFLGILIPSPVFPQCSGCSLSLHLYQDFNPGPFLFPTQTFSLSVLSCPCFIHYPHINYSQIHTSSPVFWTPYSSCLFNFFIIYQMGI